MTEEQSVHTDKLAGAPERSAENDQKKALILYTLGGGLRARSGSVQMASSPFSPVLMRRTSSTGLTNILPSPTRPVLAACSIVLTTLLTISSLTMISSLTLGMKSTTDSVPRYHSVCPFWRPKPFTSKTVIP